MTSFFTFFAKSAIIFFGKWPDHAELEEGVVREHLLRVEVGALLDEMNADGRVVDLHTL